MPGTVEKSASRAGASLFFRDHVFLYCVGLLGYYCFVIWALWRSPNHYWGMYANTDGMWAAWTVEGILKWGYPFDFSPYNILSGMGSMFTPNLPWLNPGAMSLGLPFDKGARYVVSYTIYFLELLVSIVVLLRVIGLSPLRSIIAAQLYAFVLFPPTSQWFLSLNWYSLAPVNAHLVAIANFALCLFVRTGDCRLGRNIACAVGVLALTLCAIVSAPVSFLTYVPIYVLMALAAMMGQPPRRQAVIWKTGLVIALAIAFWGLGFPEYLAATRDLSARTENLALVLKVHALPDKANVLQEIWAQYDICNQPQELLCRKYPVFWFHVLAVAGAATTLLGRGSRLRSLAALFLLYYALVHAWDFASYAQLFGELHVITVPYLVWASYPLFALSATQLIFAPFDSLRQRLRVAGSGQIFGTSPRAGGVLSIWPKVGRRQFLLPAAVLLSLAIPFGAYQLWKNDIRPFQPPKQAKIRNSILGTSPAREPVVGAITRYLIDHASLTPGGPFRGYTVTYFGSPAGHIRKHLNQPQQGMGWEIHVASREYLDAHYGNRFQEMDLWDFDIPTLEEYGQWVTKQANAFATQLFSSPGDIPNAVMLRVYKLELDLLRAAGVRFLIADLELVDPRLSLRAEQRSSTAGPIYLYEIADPNLATYSPIDVVKAATFEAAMEILQQDSRALNRWAVVFDGVDGQFAAASQSKMLVERDGLHVVARSSGHSMVLLPVQYSRCLKITPEPSKDGFSSARLVRANGIQTALIFDRDVDIHIRFEFGFFGTARCRRQDAEELRAIRISG
jgi:hypothetical protein